MWKGKTVDFIQKLRILLEKSGIEYELIYHEISLRSAEEGAGYFGISPGQTAPTLILETERGLMGLVISGGQGRIDLQRLGSALCINKVKMASPGKILEETGFHVGSIPLVGLDLPLILDCRIFDFSFIYGGAGVPGWTLKIRPEALRELNRVHAVEVLEYMV